jgi:hypothetical protein
VPATTEPTEEQQLASVLVDLQRYGDDEPGRSPPRAERRHSASRQAAHGLQPHPARDPADARQDAAGRPAGHAALETVIKSNPGSPAAKQLAAVVQVQVAERVRAVRDEQQKADAAQKKLEALRNMERDLLRDRIRSGGGEEAAVARAEAAVVAVVAGAAVKDSIMNTTTTRPGDILLVDDDPDL